MEHEELRQCKMGQVVYLRATIEKVVNNGNEATIKIAYACEGRTTASIGAYHEQLVLPPTPPKYDPRRKYKEGDMVSPCFWYDRPPAAYYISEASGHFTPEDGLYEVDKDEMPDATVLVRYKDKVISMQACQLELMTPVEELEPFRVSYTNGECGMFEVMRGEQCVSVYPYGSIESRYYKKAEQAQAAAEAERDRLNAEWRKGRNENEH